MSGRGCSRSRVEQAARVEDRHDDADEWGGRRAGPMKPMGSLIDQTSHPAPIAEHIAPRFDRRGFGPGALESRGPVGSGATFGWPPGIMPPHWHQTRQRETSWRRWSVPRGCDDHVPSLTHGEINSRLTGLSFSLSNGSCFGTFQLLGRFAYDVNVWIGSFCPISSTRGNYQWRIRKKPCASTPSGGASSC
jgi:hypothetical protein